MYSKKYETSKNNQFTAKPTSDRLKRLLKSLVKQIARIGKNFGSNYGKISETEDSCQNVMAKDAPLVNYIATLTTPDKTSSWKTGKNRSIAMLSLLLSKRNAFLGLFFGRSLDDLLDFAPKIRNFSLQARKKTYKTKKFKKKVF